MEHSFLPLLEQFPDALAIAQQSKLSDDMLNRITELSMGRHFRIHSGAMSAFIDAARATGIEDVVTFNTLLSHIEALFPVDKIPHSDDQPGSLLEKPDAISRLYDRVDTWALWNRTVADAAAQMTPGTEWET